ncbi:hypothetical protein [Streptomyces sp. Je 1-369]|uniref:hypothetical protein n=1 Tax=Streptomyces sp. Je 1-369 TaxID=2966192 RepID=UPI0022854858|nr:hypothetical protein [Streptomyces sp. Je 1-369]WAL97552.1 hypothetical protein NOO62_25490 [Streptomyces sp. Je 1-369]
MVSTEPGPETWEELLGAAGDEVARTARQARVVADEAIPDAVEEFDAAARMLAFTFAPGTYKGLIAGVVLHARHVNLMFSEGVALEPYDTGGLLTGTGKWARHIKLHGPEDAADPGVAELLSVAARRRREQLQQRPPRR